MPRTNEQFNKMKDISRQKIINAGLILFSRKGLAATSIIDIAKAAGVSSGLLYHYFKSKEDLFLEIVNIAMNNSGDYLEEMIDDDLKPADKIRLITKIMCRELLKDDIAASYFVLMIRAILEGNMTGKAAEKAKDALRPISLLVKIISEGQKTDEIKKGDPFQMAFLYWAAFQGLSEYKLTITKAFHMPDQELINGILLKFC